MKNCFLTSGATNGRIRNHMVPTKSCLINDFFILVYLVNALTLIALLKYDESAVLFIN